MKKRYSGTNVFFRSSYFFLFCGSSPAPARPEIFADCNRIGIVEVFTCDWKKWKEDLRGHLRGHRPELETLRSFGLFLLLMLLIEAAEFGINFFTKNNLSFFNPFFQALPTFLALSAPVLLLGGRASKVYISFLLILVLFLEVIGGAVLFRFKVQFGADMVFVALSSSFAELTEFIHAYYGWPSAIFALLCFLGVTGAILVFFWRRPFTLTWRLRLIGAILLLPFLISTARYCLKKEYEKAFNRCCVTRVFSGFFDFSRQWSSLFNACKTPEVPEVKQRVRTDRPLTGIIVIGESAMRKHQGLYGYCRQTTPSLSKRNDLFLFDDVISAWGSTTNSLRCVMTRSTLDDFHNSRCSIIDVFRRGGFRVSFLSNQFRWGSFDSPVSLMFQHADRIVYQQEFHRHALDDGLVALVNEELRSHPGVSHILFVHLIGSHSDPASRYPAGFGPFTGVRDAANADADEETARHINEYDNSIAFTDLVLGQLADIVAGQKDPAFLLYFSDHGSVIDDGKKTLRSSRSSDASVYEVPFILQLNEAYRQTFPDIVRTARDHAHAPLQCDRLFWGMAALADLQGTPQDDRENFFSESYVPHPVRLVSEGRQPYKKGVDGK